MHRAGGNVDKTARRDFLQGARTVKVDSVVNDIKRLVPGMKRRRRPDALGRVMEVDLITAGLAVVRQDGDALAENLAWDSERAL